MSACMDCGRPVAIGQSCPCYAGSMSPPTLTQLIYKEFDDAAGEDSPAGRGEGPAARAEEVSGILKRNLDDLMSRCRHERHSPTYADLQRLAELIDSVAALEVQGRFC